MDCLKYKNTAIQLTQYEKCPAIATNEHLYMNIIFKNVIA